MLQFWLHRVVQAFSHFKILEGVAYRPSFSLPHIIIAVTTLVFQTPGTSPLFVFTSLPILIHICYRGTPKSSDNFRKLGCLAAALFGNSIWSSWGLLDNHGEILIGQAVFSAAVAAMTIAPILGHRCLTDWGVVRKEGWEIGPAFGLLWASGWALFAWLSPFGSFGVPSLPITSSAAAWVRHILERTGVDILLGITAYTAYQLGSFLYPPTVQYMIEDGDRSFHSGSDSFAFPDSRQASPVTVSVDSPPWQDNRAATATASENSSLLPSPVTQSTSSTIRIRTARKTGSALSALATAALWAGCSTFDPAAELQNLSAGIEHQTPLGIGLVLPPIHPGESHASIDSLIHEARIIGNRANLLVFPETALVAKTAFERYDAIDRMVEEVCKQYGVWVQLGIDSYDGSWSEEHGIEVKREGRLNQVVLLSPEGVMDSYTKQKLFPYVESYPFHPGIMKIPTWNMYLPSPPGVNKTDWTVRSPYVRTIRISPAICLDSFHPNLFDKLDPLPDILTISASMPTFTLGKHILGRAESLALTHNVPVMLVASGSKGRADGSGISALIDGWGRHLHLQRGGRSTVVQVMLPYGDNKKRRAGWWSRWLGTTGVLGAGIAIIVGGAGYRRHQDGQLLIRNTVQDGSSSRLIRVGSAFSLRSLRTSWSSKIDKTSPAPTRPPLDALSTSQLESGDNRPNRRSQQRRAHSYGTVPDTRESADSADPLLPTVDGPVTPTPLDRRSAANLWSD